jgi:AmmeMemoRadiSam system protein B
LETRRAAHAGSWYSSNKTQLNTQLDTFLSNASKLDLTTTNNASSITNGHTEKRVKGIIGPHAGYRYSGQTSAYAYKNIDNTTGIKTVFVLGPSHHMYMNNECGLSKAHILETPIGNLKVNKKLNDELLSKHRQLFHLVKSMEDEEEEHSLEMHFPFIAKVFDVNRITVVPIIVGHLDSQTAKSFGQALAPYLADPSCFFVISSDFCHWGTRFNYTYYDKSKGEIWQSIKELDLMGAEYISNLDTAGFESYLKKYKNTICGRHAILILLNTLAQSNSNKYEIKLIHYSQSSKVVDPDDSSVSYASFCLLEST